MRATGTARRPLFAVASAVAVFGLASGVSLAGCQKVTTETEPQAKGKESRAVAITITDSGCQLDPGSISAGPVTFQVKNKDAKVVNEAELINAEGRILGERENLTPGLGGSFSKNLDAGDYSIYCPGAETESVAFEVTGKAKGASTPPPEISAHLKQGTDGYADYVKSQTGQLVTATKEFTDAVRAGDVEKAKELYGPARVFWERIESVAESFGDLDPAVDARVNDVEDPKQWTGFHPIERALWEKNTTQGMAPLADQLDADVAELDRLVQTTTYEPADLANGATTLLTEVAATKITGEEERYSHIDLLDIWANVDGAKRAFDLLGPALKRIDPAMVSTINERFTDVNHVLAKHRDGNSFALYNTLTEEQTKELADAVDALAEPLSKVAEKVVEYK